MRTEAHLLHEVATLRAGHPFRGRIAEHADSPTVAVQIRDTSPDGITWGSCVRTQLGQGRAPAWLQEGQVLFAARGTRYYAVVVEGIPAGWQAVAAPHFYILQPKSDALLPAFLAWQLNHAPCQQYFEQQAEGSVTKSIKRSLLESAPIAVPSLAEQKAVVALATTLQKEQNILAQLIENNRRLLGGIAGDLLRGSQPPRSRAATRTQRQQSPGEQP